MKTPSRTLLDPGRGYEIRGGLFESRIVTIGAGDTVDSIFGEAVFRDCELRVLSTTRQSMNFHATFIDCDIRASKPLKNKRMDATSFINCRFSGRFSGCEFGPKFRESPGRLESCDFSEARLSMTEFFDCDIESQRWPDWPNIYLLYGEDLEWTKQLPDESLPQKLLSLIRLPRHERVTPRSILSIHLPSEDLDEEMTWALIQDSPQIWFPSKSKKVKVDPRQVGRALSANRAALARLTRTRARTVLLGNLHRSWLKSVRRISNEDVELVFDCSFLRQRVPSAPERVCIRLHRGSARHRLESSAVDLNGELDRFMLMGVSEEEDEILLKPHRKERGQVLLSFESYSVFDDQNQPMQQAELLNMVSQYYGRSGS